METRCYRRRREMSTIEKVLVQIFERKNRIIDHVKQQILLFDHQLASKCLIDGLVPPPWLLSSSPSELNKEDLMSGLLLPHPQASIPYCSLYQQPVVTTDNVQMPHILCSRVDASNEGLDQCLSSKADDLDPSVTSPPQNCRDGMISDICPDLFLSAARIQRSKSRQRALEHRNSAKVCKNTESSKKNGHACNSENKVSKFASLQSDPVDKLELIRSVDLVVSYEVEKEERGQCRSKERSENVYSGKVTRSRSSIHPSKSGAGHSGTCNNFFVIRQDNVASYEVEKGETVECRSKEMSEKVYSGRVTRSRSSVQPSKSVSGPSGAGNTSVAKQDVVVLRESISKSRQQLDVGHELLESKFVEPVYSTLNCGVKTEERDQCQSKARGEDIYSGRITRSRGSLQPSKSVNGSSSAGKSFSVVQQDGIVLTESIKKSRLHHDAADDILQFAKPIDTVVTCLAEKEERGQCQSKERSENIYSGNMTKAKHSVQSPKSLNRISCAGKTLDVAKRDGNMLMASICESKQQPVVDELLVLVKPPVIPDGSCGSKKARDHQSQEKENNVYEGRLMRSRSSSQWLNCANIHLNLDSCPDRSNNDGIYKPVQVACPANDLKETSNNQTKPTAVIDQYNNGSIRSSANRSANLFKLVDSSDSLEYEIQQSKSKASNKSLFVKSSERSEGVEFKEVSGSQVNSLPCAIDSGPAELNKCDAIVADSDADSDALVEAHSPSSASNLDGFNNPPLSKSLNINERVALDVVGTSPHSETAMMVLPKQLDFEDLGECTLNVASSPISEHEEMINSLEKRSLTPVPSADKLDEVTSVHYLDKYNLYLEKQFPEEQEAFRKEDKKSEKDLNKTSGVGRTSNSNIVSSVKETPEAPADAVTSIPRESHEISKQKNFMENLSTTSKASHENLLANSIKDAAGSNLVADTGMNSLFEKDYGKLEVVKCGMSVQKASTLNTDVCSSGPAILAGVCSPALLRKADATTDDAIEHPCAALFEETKGHFLKQKMESIPSQNQDAYLMGRCIADDIDPDLDHKHAKSSENKVRIQPIWPGRCADSSWPHKRRKIDGQQINCLYLSLSLKEEGIMQLNADKYLVNEEDQKEGKCSWKERGENDNTPSTFVHKQFDVASISSLPQETLEKFEDHSMEGTKSVDPSRTMFGSTRKCTAEENKVLLHVGYKSEFRNIEQFTCNERSKQESKSQLGEDCEFSTSLIDSPCLPPTDLISADQSRPELEGFIIQNDSVQACIGGDEVRFDNLDLPKTTIERASLLEQLCKSACIHTPLSQFPTTYRLHRKTDLCQSVPNGLLESKDLRSTLLKDDVLKGQLKVSTSCFGEDTNHAFLRGYFSNCLPFSSSQVTGDGKKTNLSPVGKLWDKITSNTGSSEKRGSLNPDLPCISEENENTDVLDAFQEDTVSEVVTCSVKREPLAEIMEYPNVPAPVSGADQFTIRDSLDSVNTAYSFTGMENGFKQKVGRLKASKRRDTSKLKEKWSMLPRANATKRASESLRNRFSKPKLSEKTSLRKGGPSFSQEESKVNNIVSNITSFIPIVQQKQAASVITGKRDVKVKALEAAEAAKKLAEKKENDRKMKKEALKLERARLEQENLRQLELEKKKKEEQQKKKEADMAARKRQREEEERLERERKRKRMEEAWRQQRVFEEKLRSKKDENEKECQALDKRAKTMKVPNDEAAKHKKIEKELAGGNERTVSEMEFRTVVCSTSDAVKASTTIEDYNMNVLSTMDRARESDNLIADISQEQSYDISPYKVSDDEDDEEDDESNSKFIPSWASKNHVALLVASQQQVDPEVIFPPESFCSISEVLLPRKLQQFRAG